MFLLLLATFLTITGFCTSKNTKELHKCHEEHNTRNCAVMGKNWFYNTSSKRCMALTVRGCENGTRYFDNKSDCNRHCRDRIYGKCAMKRYRRNCSQQQLKVRFNPNNQTCEWYLSCLGEQHSFENMNECYEKCGEFVTNPCVLPIRAIREELRFTEAAEFRYGYDRETKKCVKFLRSSIYGNINNFSSRKKCLQTCTPSSPCLLQTEYHRWGLFHSYFYDPDHDTCNITWRFSWKTKYWPETNRFSSPESCHKQCMPDLSSLIHKAYRYVQ